MRPTRRATTSQVAITNQIVSTTQRIRLLWAARSLPLVGVTGIRARLYRRATWRSSGSRRASRALLALIAGALLTAGLTPRAIAQDPAPGARLDFPRGPVIGSSRVTGLAGAFTGVAEGIDGALKNPASLANRVEHSTSWLDVDLAFDLLQTTGDDIDFDADRIRGGRSAAFDAVNLGLDLQLDTFAIGFLGAFDSWTGGGDAHGLDATLLDLVFAAAQAFGGGEVIVGLGVNVRALTLTEHLDDGDAAVTLSAETFDLGLLWRPRELPWRIGAQLRLGGTLTPRDAVGTFSDEHRVRDVIAPWQLGIGVSHRWTADPERAYNAPLRETKPPRDRRYLLVSVDVLVSGPAPGVVNLEGFVGGAPRRAGVTPTVSLHVGAEGEVLHDRLRARVGTYLEPSRASNTGIGRLHMTGGVELHLFELWLFDLKTSFAFDASAGYTNVLFGVGLWN